MRQALALWNLDTTVATKAARSNSAFDEWERCESLLRAYKATALQPDSALHVRILRAAASERQSMLRTPTREPVLQWLPAWGLGLLMLAVALLLNRRPQSQPPTPAQIPGLQIASEMFEASKMMQTAAPKMLKGMDEEYRLLSNGITGAAGVIMASVP